MSRVKKGPIPRQRHNRVFKQTKGFVDNRRNHYREAVRVLFKSWEYTYVERKLHKRDFRTLWIQRINAACRVHGTTYSRFIAALKASEVELDRKVLADIAVSDPKAFAVLADTAKAALAAAG